MDIIKNDNKGYFEDILELRRTIYDLCKELIKIKDDAIKSYKRKKSNSVNQQQNIKNDLIFAVLFGNNIIL
jgi:hypothetical protein